MAKSKGNPYHDKATGEFTSGGALGGKAKPIGSKYTLKELDAAADKAGHALFDKHSSGYLYGPAKTIKYKKLSELQSYDPDTQEESYHIGTYEHLFFPSTGKGLDVADESWQDAQKNWADKDGKIYTKWEDEILVVEPDVPLLKPLRLGRMVFVRSTGKKFSGKWGKIVHISTKGGDPKVEFEFKGKITRERVPISRMSLDT